MKEVASTEGDKSSKTVKPGESPSLHMTPSNSVALTSLVPHYQNEQHQTYVNRLEEAINEPKNLNIALTGRYGAGKSSVLDKFEENHKSTTLRLSISTLGPNNESATLTNRIQKELVKQLVYSASPQTLRHTRFARRVELPWWRAAIEVAVMVAIVGAFLILIGWLPLSAGPLSGHNLLFRTIAWVGFALVLVAGGTELRLATHDRFTISDISAGGATVKLSERTPTYFDEYLDDIVNYFDNEDVDIVIFEDLDRFDDPHIFEALRELNTLLNHTKQRIKKRKPLCFVYAVRDSLFEKLGADTKINGDDAATAETVRANRTKFFDIVIPMVPFISHRNARDLLTGLLKTAGIAGIDRSLISLVARYCTDMRLLQNICNEYLVFSERLLETKKVAPGLTPSNLFALVAYKNFHLEDFENISRRTSDLDRLYDFRRELVRSSIVVLEDRKRDLISRKEKSRISIQLAQRLGDWLRAFAQFYKKFSPYSGWQGISYVVGEHSYASSDVDSYEFWTAVAKTKSIVIQAFYYQQRSNLISLSGSDLAALGPDGMEPDRWREIDEDATQSKLENIDKAIAFLRGADFADLATKTQYSLKVTRPTVTQTMSDDGKVSSPTTPESSDTETAEVECTFAGQIADTMKSELAHDLVKQGFLDRNFALYAAQFYGNFNGVDVANFIVQNVQTNTMEVDYEFTSPGAIANLLAEADDDFTHTKAAYNIDVLDFLLDSGDRRADNVVDHIIADFDDDAHSFLASYFTSGAQREKLAASLASRPWAKVFHYLIVDDGVPADLRSALVSAALAAIDLDQDYNLTTMFNAFIVEHYNDMPVFTQPQTEAVAKNIATLVDRINVLIPDLGPIDDALRVLIVNDSQYELTAVNLYIALDSDETRNVDNIGFDYVHQNKTVYEYCLAHPDNYLAAVQNDAATQYTAYDAETLLVVLSDTAEKWDDKQLTGFIRCVAPESRVDSLNKVPTATWPILADADLFRVSLSNVESYRKEIGSIDEHLARLLKHTSTIETDKPGDTVDINGNEIDKSTAAIAILNAKTIKDPATRVALAHSLNANLPLSVADITPEPNDLLARLIENSLITDEAASFAHFQGMGWAAIGPAVAASNNITSFLTPDLAQGMVADLLNDAAIRDKVGDQVVTNLEEYVPKDDPAALTAAAKYANKHHIQLTPETVLRIAHANTAKQDVLRLLDTASPAANAQQIIAVFDALGQPYSSIPQSGTSFDVDYDEFHDRLLTTLQQSNVCTFKKKRNKNLYTVNVL
ncbi:MAG: YobI family P-loop NTPase [Bifidobacterium crudilactis]|uniref:YobI family P-loop NTPase n=1 Tax=Bifidobacterium crudilactis TaxID=327277 RepID=UPI003F9C0D7C